MKLLSWWKIAIIVLATIVFAKLDASAQYIQHEDGSIAFAEGSGDSRLDLWAFTPSSLGTEAMIGIRFQTPNGTELTGLHFGLLSQSNLDPQNFSGNRSFRFVIYQSDSVAYPGDVLMDVVVQHNNAEPGNSDAIGILDLDLTGSNVYGVFFVAVGAVDTVNGDDNPVVVPFAEFSGEPIDNPSILYYPFSTGAGWAYFNTITIGGERLWDDRVPIIRATFSAMSTSVEDETLPARVTLFKNYPNPFNPVTTISYEIPKATQVTLRVVDSRGRTVSVLRDSFQSAGRYEAQFDARHYPSGVYLAILHADGDVRTQKMILVK